MSEEYYLLFNTGYGIGIDHFESADKLKEYIKENFSEEYTFKPVFLNKMPSIRKGFNMTDAGIKEGEEGFIVIKGKIIVPRPVEVVTKYEIE